MALQTSMVLFEWDDETLAPKGAAEHTARVIGSLSEQYQEILASMRFKELQSLLERAMALQTSMVVFEWDDETLAPKGAAVSFGAGDGNLDACAREK